MCNRARPRRVGAETASIQHATFFLEKYANPSPATRAPLGVAMDVSTARLRQVGETLQFT